MLIFLLLKVRISECAPLNQNAEVDEQAKCAPLWFPYSRSLSLTGIS